MKLVLIKGRPIVKLLTLFLVLVLVLFGCNDSSSSGSGKDNSTPKTPSGLVITALSFNSVKLDWQASSGGNGNIEYRIYRNGVQVSLVSDITWTDASVSSLTKYCYAVSAADSSGNESVRSDEACATTPSDESIDNRDTSPPSVPSDLSVTPVSSTGMTVKWAASNDDKDVVAYRVYRNGWHAATVETTSWSDGGLIASSDFCYSVSAVDPSGNESAKSGDVCAKTSSPPAPPVDDTPPAKPVSLSAVASSSSVIQVTWEPGGSATDVKEYRIYRNGEKIGTTQAASFADQGLTPSTNYCYALTAVNAAGIESEKSDQTCVSTKPDTEPPPVPTEIKTSAKTMDSVTLEWSALTRKVNAKAAYHSGYKIYRNGVFIGFTTGNTYTDTGLLPGTSYCYTIKAVDEYGNESAGSEFFCVETSPDTAAPSSPSGLTAKTMSSSAIMLNWSASTDNSGTSSYRIYRNGAFKAETSSPLYVDSGLQHSTYYCYTVSAFDSSGNESAKTNSACSSTDSEYIPPYVDTTPPSVPTGLTAVAESLSSVKLTWGASTDNTAVTGYRIYRAGVLKATVNTLTWTETGLTASTAYCYKVSAIDASGNESATSDEKCATTQAPIVLRKLNDTGIDWWSRFGINNSSAFDSQDYPGQDADYGRDITVTDPGDGHAGFSFTKIDSSGNDMLPIMLGWGAVRDNVTGLMWENKTDDGGLHDKDNEYFWYEPDNTINGDLAGEGPANSTYEFVQAVNAENYCGHNDWRMPTKEELRSIVNYGTTVPAIDTFFFQYTVNDCYWSSSPAAHSYSYVWCINFGYGMDSLVGKNGGSHVRLVRDCP